MVSMVSTVSQALLRFPAHLQQVDMESNGKFVNLEGVPVTSPIPYPFSLRGCG